jgi:hypothetical protein
MHYIYNILAVPGMRCNASRNPPPPARHRMKFVECIVQFRGFRERRNVREI